MFFNNERLLSSSSRVEKQFGEDRYGRSKTKYKTEKKTLLAVE